VSSYPPSEETRLDLALCTEQVRQCDPFSVPSEDLNLLIRDVIGQIVSRSEAGAALLNLIVLVGSAVRGDERDYQLMLTALQLDGEHLCPETDQRKENEP
jgi:hypothetical protein